MAYYDDDQEEESFFVSMTDIMVGLLFIFILIIMYFAVQAKIDALTIEEAEIENQRQTALIAEFGDGERYSELNEYQIRVGYQRSNILKWISLYLEAQGIDGIQIVEEQGVLRLPEGLLFNSGEYRFESDSQAFMVAQSLSRALNQILPCSVLASDGKPFVEKSRCEKSFYHNKNNAFVQAIYLEGHTDNQAINEDIGLSGDPNLTNNLKLSARRSTNTFDSIISERPQIIDFHGPVSDAGELRFEPVLASSAYGEWRPAASNETEEGRQSNRRIDLRIVMYVPANIDSMKIFAEAIGAGLEMEAN